MGGWSELPGAIVRSIEEKLDFYEDKVKCICVCSTWQLALPKMPHQKQHLPPWLLVPLKTKTETSFGFFDPLDRKLHCLKLSHPHKGMVFRGSCHGWVVNIVKKNSICAINPLTAARVKFPDLFNKPGPSFITPSKDDVGESEYFIRKVILSASPQSHEDFVAVAIHGEFARLAYCKRGDNKWSLLDRDSGGWCDVIFHRQQLYAVACDGSAMVCDIHSSLPKMTPFASKLTKRLSTDFHLVESSVGLIVVRRDLRYVPEIGVVDSCPIQGYKTGGFRIFKHDTSRGEWYQTQTIGDDMVFWGWNSSFSVSCKNFPGHAGNCIVYFTDDDVLNHYNGVICGSEMAVFNLSDGSIQHLPGYRTCDSELSIWFMPNLIN